jgi:hypothetical protein
MASSSSSSYSSMSVSAAYGCTHGIAVHNPTPSGGGYLLNTGEFRRTE